MGVGIFYKKSTGIFFSLLLTMLNDRPVCCRKKLICALRAFFILVSGGSFMKVKFSTVRFSFQASVSSLLAFMLVFSPMKRNAQASCSPAPSNGDDTITCTTANDTLDAQDGNDVVNGGSGTDSLTGGNGNDTLNGGAGNDTLNGGAGDDTLTGGTGNDVYVFDTNTALGTDTITEVAGEGTDRLNFSGSNGTITVNLGTIGGQSVNGNLTLDLTAAQVEQVTGGNVDDTITGNTLNNVLTGGSGNDALNGMDGNDTLNGENGDDTLNGGIGADTLNGDAGADILNGDAGGDTLSGGADNDMLTGGAGNDIYMFDTDTSLGTDTVTEAAAGGTDRLNFSASNDSIAVNLGTTGNQFINSNLTLNLTAAQVENVIGGNSDDVITGNALNNVLSGGSGNDILSGMDGNDTLNADDGDNILNGGNGADILNGGIGNDIITGGAGNDSLNGDTGDDFYAFDTDTTLGTDTITENTNEGTDTLDFTGSSNVITVNLGTTLNQVVNSNLTLNLATAEIENAAGGDNNDDITGNTLKNILSGGAGDDTLNGMDGNDMLSGADGTDTLNGGSGDDSLDGGADNDVLNGDAGADTLDGNDGDDTLDGGLDDDQLNGDAGDDTLNGGDGDDTLNGGSDDDQLNGEAGADILNGGDGVDTLDGGLDDDQLNGEAGADILNGGDGSDTLDGGLDDDQLNGDAGSDILNGGDGADTLNGGDGDDALNGEGGNDTLTTDQGVDALDGGADDDTLIIAGTHSIGDLAAGGTGQNVFVFKPGTTGSIELVSTGEDALDFSQFDSAINIDLGKSTAQDVGGGLNLTLTGLFKSIAGTVFGDTIVGNSLDNIIEGLDGNDTLSGGSGTDAIDGGTGADKIVNYEVKDTHTNIESGLPVIVPPPVVIPPTTGNNSVPADSQDDSPLLVAFMPSADTSSNTNPIACETNPAIMNFQMGTLAFHNLCGFSVSLNVISNAEISPSGIVPLFAMDMSMIKDSVPVEMPAGTKIIWKVPADVIGAVHFSNDKDHTEWTEMGMELVNGFYEIDLAEAGVYVLAEK
jgi:Ca2+-binding RTX toxin-like protein